MSVLHHHTEKTRTDTNRTAAATADDDTRQSATVARVLATLRITTGLLFLWAFLDKTFGLGYATPAQNAWIDGGSPTKGFLGGVSAGPLQDMFNAWAGQAWADWLFMIALAGVGVAVLLGIGLRVSAAAGVALMLFMWVAEWPLARHTSTGELTRSTNPLIDYHVVYAIVLVLLAACYAGHTWGLGRMWAQLPLVRRNRWLI